VGELKFKADCECSLKDFLINKEGVSKRFLSKLKRTENGITRNGLLIRTVDMVYKGDVIVLKTEDESFLEPNPDLDVRIAFENESLVVFDKPVGMPVHPSIKHQGDTLGNFFAAKYPKLTFRPVNRLDRDTSGLCLAAKNPYAAVTLQNSVKKVYYAVAEGKTEDYGTIDLPIAREKESIIKRTVRSDGQQAVTHFRAIDRNEKYTLLEINLETGRTHQIRVHSAYLGCPLMGDDMYGGRIDEITRHALHSCYISFTHPVTNARIELFSDMPEDMKKLIER